MAEETPVEPVEADPGEAALAAAIASVESATDPEDVASFSPAAQRMIAGLRSENAKSRIALRDANAGFQTERQKLVDEVAGMLGLKPDLNPEVLSESLRQAQDERAASIRELAIYKSASQSGADPAKILDSRSVMQTLADVDPNDHAALAAAIQAAVAANPTLRQVQAAASSGTPLAGSGESAGQLTEEQFAAIQNDPEAIVAAQKAGRLRHILGSI